MSTAVDRRNECEAIPVIISEKQKYSKMGLCVGGGGEVEVVFSPKKGNGKWRRWVQRLLEVKTERRQNTGPGGGVGCVVAVVLVQ